VRFSGEGGVADGSGNITVAPSSFVSSFFLSPSIKRRFGSSYPPDNVVASRRCVGQPPLPAAVGAHRLDHVVSVALKGDAAVLLRSQVLNCLL
jgi:hypothetical protein